MVRPDISEMYSNDDLTRPVYNSLIESDRLLEHALVKNTERVALGIGNIHKAISDYNVFNKEVTIKIAIRYAYYTASDYYKVNTEIPVGNGYIDVVFTPKKIDLKLLRLTNDRSW